MNHSRHLPRSTPEAQGIPSSAILAFLDAAQQNNLELHSLMLLRHGAVVAEGWWHPYAADRPHMLFSLSKSFTSTAIGLAVAEGRLKVTDAVLSFFPEDVPDKVSPHLAAMQVRHLLSMSTGHAKDTSQRISHPKYGSWVRGFLAQPVKYPPGTHFVYNNGASYMLSAIIQKLTGQTLLEYLEPRLFAPLGIQGATWESDPQGINFGGWGLSIKTEDIARFGQLYLQRGSWNGQRLLPESWVAEATSKQVDNYQNQTNPDWQQGYGYQFWRCRHGAYRGDGAFGQYCIVMPAQEAVLAITSGVEDMQAVLNLVWQHLLPALGAAPLPADSAALDRLQRRLAGLALPAPAGNLSSPVAVQAAGKQYQFHRNPLKIKSLTFDFAGDQCQLTVRDRRGAHLITCRMANWLEGTTTAFVPADPMKVAASAVWQAEDTLQVTLRFYETPFCQTLTCRFAEQRVHLRWATNVSFGPKEMPELVGITS